MRRLLAILILLPLSAAAGCLERTLRIETTPPGARVILDQKELADRTPVDLSFTYGGVREIILLHEDDPEHIYKPVRVLADTEVFHYDVFPFDFLSEIAPVTLEDRHVLHFDLERSTLAETVGVDADAYQKAVLKRAAELRERARAAQEARPDPFAEDGGDEEDEDRPASRPAESAPTSEPSSTTP